MRTAMQAVMGASAADAIVGAVTSFVGSRAWLQQRLRTQPKAVAAFVNCVCIVATGGSVGIGIYYLEKGMWAAVQCVVNAVGCVGDLGDLYASTADPVPWADLLVRCALVFTAPLLVYAALLLEQDAYDAANDTDLAAATDRIRHRPALGGSPWPQWRRLVGGGPLLRAAPAVFGPQPPPPAPRFNGVLLAGAAAAVVASLGLPPGSSGCACGSGALAVGMTTAVWTYGMHNVRL
jgi:hypothetical protein